MCLALKTFKEKHFYKTVYNITILIFEFYLTKVRSIPPVCAVCNESLKDIFALSISCIHACHTHCLRNWITINKVGRKCMCPHVTFFKSFVAFQMCRCKNDDSLLSYRVMINLNKKNCTFIFN